jgi:hypothetical protein
VTPDFKSWDDHEALQDESAGLAPLAVVCCGSILAGGIVVTLLILAARHMARHLGGI